MTLNFMHLEESIPTITELLDIPISNYITLAANDCGYSGTAKKLIFNYVHQLFLKAKAAASALHDALPIFITRIRMSSI